MATPAPRSVSFGVRLALAVLVLSLLPLGVFAGVVTTNFRSALTGEVNAGLASDADGIQQMLEAGLSERDKNVQSWAEDAIVRGALMYNAYDKTDAGLKVLQARYPQFAALVLFDGDGRAVSASDPAVRDRYAARAAEIAQAPWFRAATRGETTSEGVELVDVVLDKRVLHFARPVTSPTEGKTMGVLMAAFDWSNRLREMVDPALHREQQRGYSSFEIVVARLDGKVLFDSSDTAGIREADVRKLLAGGESTRVSTVADKVAVLAHGGARAGWVVLSAVDEAEVYAPVKRSVWLAVGLVGVFAVAAVALSFLLSRRLVRPINTLNGAVERIVREGDLTQKIEAESGDEIGQLAATFSKMVEKLREIPESLQESTLLLSSSVENLRASTSQQSQTITRQAAALQETQVTMQEIKQTSLLAAQKAESVLRVAERAEDIGRSGEHAIEQSLSGLTDIRAQVVEIADKITGLTERTRQIGIITETVKDLADQSNMLALNAAIEAVRSGEHGKGFAVVAREIRSLADQSIQATTRVREILDDISSAIRAAVSITEKGAEKMEAGLVQVRASGENLRELSGIVKDNSSAVRQIAAAVSQQNAGITQISSAVTDLNKLMTDTVGRIQATNEAADVLKDVSGRVSSIVASYRV